MHPSPLPLFFPELKWDSMALAVLAMMMLRTKQLRRLKLQMVVSLRPGTPGMLIIYGRPATRIGERVPWKTSARFMLRCGDAIGERDVASSSSPDQVLNPLNEP